MKVGVVQFEPVHGDTKASFQLVNNLLFTGYADIDYATLAEDEDDGITARWAKETAIRLQCTVIVGFPQRIGETLYNSCMTVDKKGMRVKTYQKHFLYPPVDLKWAQAGPSFDTIEVCGKRISLAICMDINPQSNAPFHAFELANFCLAQQVDGLILLMAWRFSYDVEDIETDNHPVDERERKASRRHLNYLWERLQPLWNRSFFFIGANRTGREGNVRFCGASCILQWNPSQMKDDSGFIVEHLDSRQNAILLTTI
jgi:protein N-terminal amidase